MQQDTYIASLEEELKDARALVERQQSLVAHISHELRTPMNGVLGMARLLLETNLRPTQREYVQTIWSSADALVTLINDLLDRARLEAGKLELEEIPFQLADVVRDTVRSLEVIAVDKGLGIEVILGPDLPPTVVGDPTRLRQVLVNLIGNAIKFTEAGGIEVRVRRGDGELIEFDVADSGMGIAPERLSEIFQPFEQASISTVRTHGGTGLGLAITASLVELAGGTIDVVSVLGEGTTFTFTVHAPVPEEAVPAPTPGRASRNALVISSVGYQALIDGACRATSTAVLATDSAGSTDIHVRDIDLLIVAGEDPLDTAEELLTRFRSAAVVVITPAGQRGDAARCRALGVAAYLTGPIIEGDLVATVEAIGAGTPALITRHWLREHRATLRVLIADDSPTNRLVATRHLEERGHVAVCVENGQEAVDLLSSEAFDVVLMDIHMPVLDGYEASRAIRKLDGEAASVPIVALTGSVNDQVSCFEAGMDRFLTKPYRVEALFATIETLVER